jgi:hypothetical protein
MTQQGEPKMEPVSLKWFDLTDQEKNAKEVMEKDLEKRLEEKLEKMMTVKVNKMLDQLERTKERNFSAVRERDETITRIVKEKDQAILRLSIIETRLVILTRLVSSSKNMDKLEKDSMTMFIDTWKHEDEHPETIRVKFPCQKSDKEYKDEREYECEQFLIDQGYKDKEHVERQKYLDEQEREKRRYLDDQHLAKEKHLKAVLNLD